VKSKGSKEFSALGSTGVDLAKQLGCAVATVSRWKTGEATPEKGYRLKIYKLGGPEPDAWDVLETDAKPSRRKKRTTKATPTTVAEEADLWLHAVQDLRDELPKLVKDIAGRARLMREAAGTLNVLGRLTGIGLTVSARQILDSPNFRIIEGKIIAALEPWPDALRAVAEAIDDTRDGG
jgi:transcriptional regulator with XRE-family HTH domain